jgi:hypothetical protein
MVCIVGLFVVKTAIVVIVSRKRGKERQRKSRGRKPVSGFEIETYIPRPILLSSFLSSFAYFLLNAPPLMTLDNYHIVSLEGGNESFIIDKRYRIIRKVGSGSYGSVCSAINTASKEGTVTGRQLFFNLLN